MTHIYEDIRIDAIKFMELWLNIAPDIIVDGFWQRVNHYKFFDKILALSQTCFYARDEFAEPCWLVVFFNYINIEKCIRTHILANQMAYYAQQLMAISAKERSDLAISVCTPYKDVLIYVFI